MTDTGSTQLSPSAEVQACYLNVAAYKFVTLNNLPDRRVELKQQCQELGLRGTILLSPEGINLFLAGNPVQVRQFLGYLRGQDEFSGLEVKESYSEKIPFRRLLVRLKKEIIPCGLENIRPFERTSPKIAPQELRRWLDEGRKVRLLDVRNNYEIDLGTFRGAEQLNLGHFRDFPEAITRLPEEAKAEPLVMFCTGGIRCEKAGPVLEQAGFENVFQLDGGILKYFEECGGDHYDGSCFVFDGRVALTPQLKPTGNLLCFHCQSVLTAEDVTSGKFLFGEYCPHCYRSPDEQRQSQLEQRQRRILDIACQQPGSTPYTNVREIHVPGRFSGFRLIDFLSAWQPGIPSEQWLDWIRADQIRSEDGTACRSEMQVREGQRFIQEMPNTVEPRINPKIELIWEEEHLLLVNKPAPLPCHPSGRFNRNTLLSILSQAYPREKLRGVHRLDSLTTGATLLCRKHRAAKFVQAQFQEHQVEKVYLARVWGHPDWTTRDCTDPISRTPVARLGQRSVESGGHSACTRFKVLRKFGDQTTLLEVRPITGRTNQIRIHLQQLGHNIVGDPIYTAQATVESGESPSARNSEPAESHIRDSRGVSQTQAKDMLAAQDGAQMCLHSSSLKLLHPDSRQFVTYTVPDPGWVAEEDLR